MNRVEIYTSKKKAVFVVLGSALFVFVGVLLLMDNLQSSEITWKFIVENWQTVFGILFFGLGTIAGMYLLFKTRLVLVIDENGITIEPTKSNRFIKWEEIDGFDEIPLPYTGKPVFIIKVRNPEQFVEKETNIFKKYSMRFNINMYGSPIGIHTGGMNISTKKFRNLLRTFYKKYKK